MQPRGCALVQGVRVRAWRAGVRSCGRADERTREVHGACRASRAAVGAAARGAADGTAGANGSGGGLCGPRARAAAPAPCRRRYTLNLIFI